MRARALRLLRVLVALAGLAAAALAGFRLSPPTLWVDPARFTRPRDAFSITDRHGQVLRQARRDGVDRRWVELRDVSPRLVEAVLAVEDARFFEHSGVDVTAMARAGVKNLLPWTRRSGASTITQQLVKLTHGRPLGLLSKVGEIARAAALERIFTKEEILEQYLNRVPFGDRIEGVARASEEYFGHPVSSLSVAEAALLAGVPQAPSVTEPRRHLGRARSRRDHVLGRLHALGRIDDETRCRAVAEAPVIRRARARPDEAPRFVDAVLARWKDGRLDRRGDALSTSLDLDLQRRTEDLMAGAVARFEARGVTNGAAVVIANATGEVLAYVGAARRGPTAPGGGLDLLARRRQPGSTLKPFVYALFFERGGTAATVLDDIALPRTGANGALFDAKDYDGRERGPVRARAALGSSLNLAALDVAGRVGQDAVVARLRGLGFRGLGAADRYGAAAVLGGLDVAPIDLAAAYVALARGGTRVPLAYVESSAAPGTRVMSSESAELTRDVLSDVRVRGDAFGADLADLAGRFALKTGTSSGWRDAWAAVFTGPVTVVVWLGDPEGRPLGGVSGFEAAAPVAARILAAAMARALADGLAAPDRAPARLVSASVCAATGLRPGARCHHVVEERFASGTLPAEVCDTHDEAGDVILPARYADWVRRTHPPGVARTFLSRASAGEEPVVREPRDGARWLVDPARGATSAPLLATVGGMTVGEVSWEVDGARLPGSAWEMAPGDHTVIAVWQGRRSRPARVRVERGGGGR
jgi:penicillin-binding protein 1C